MYKMKCDELKHNLMFFRIDHRADESTTDCAASVRKVMRDNMKLGYAVDAMQLTSER